MNYTELVPRPKPEDINSGLQPLSTAAVKKVLGTPRASYSDQCQPITNKKLAKRMITASVGPFKVTGLDIAVEDLIVIFAEVKTGNPELYALLSTAGMLCCRLVRGSKTVLSNHSFGLAIDIRIGGQLDVRGDGLVQRGLLTLYPYFHKHGWFWGAEYKTEDGMHFEISYARFLLKNAAR